MADTTWGNTGTVWTTAGNWSNGVPGASDNAYIIDGSTPIDGVDQATIDLAKLAIGGDYTGSVGSSSSYLIISGAAVSIQSGAGGQDVYLDSGGTAAHLAIHVDSQASAAAQTVYLKATTTCPRLVVVRGSVVLVSGTFTDVYMAHEGSGTIPNLTIGAATVTNLYGEQAYTGATSGAATVTNLYHNAGTFLAEPSATMTNIWLRGGAITDNSLATTTLVQQSGGSQFRADQNLQGKTYTTYRKMGGASFANLNNGLGNIIVTNELTESGHPPLEYS